METKIKNLLARLAFFAEDGMAEYGIVAMAKDAEALLKEMCQAQPEPVNQQQAGVYHKFNVSRTDGRDQPGGDRHGAEYFVLDVTHDKFAKPALAAYAAACRNDYPALADDMVRRYGIAQQQAEPVAWLKYPRKKPELMQVSLSEHLPVALKNSGWVSEPLYAQPPAQPVALRSVTNISMETVGGNHRVALHVGTVGEMYELGKVIRAMFAAEGCGACGDGCKGQGCRLERESPPTCQTCNGRGMIGGLLPNGGGYDGEPCPDCNTPQAAVSVPKAPTWYKRSDIVKALERMNYHTAIADELADWFLRHMQLAFNRGFYQAHGPAAATQLEELELWHLLERATGELTRRAAPHVWEQIAWKAGADFIDQRRARLAAAQKGGD